VSAESAKRTRTTKAKRHREPPARTKPAKYIFLDVVGFTHQRSVEAQSEIVGALNAIVKAACARVDRKDLIHLPTGDGMCICLLNVEDPYDIHVQVALNIVDRIHKHNGKESDPMRQFQARIGINANVDNLVTDVNGRRNVAGAGINLAQRVMSTADGNQIMVGQPVFETLVQREKYLKAFRSYSATIKHGAELAVHQFVETDHSGLNTEVPSQFREAPEEDAPLTELAAYYIAHAIANAEFLKRQVGGGQDSYASIILLYFLAQDSIGASEAPKFDPYTPTAWGDGRASIEEQFKHYMSMSFWTCAVLGELIFKKYLSPFEDCFEAGRYSTQWQFVSGEGMRRLREEFPQIWKEFKLARERSETGPPS
jgi:class 3 adenylate cyclase